MEERADKTWSLRRFWPLLAILLGIVLFFASGLGETLTLDHLKAHHDRLIALVAAHYALAIFAFILFYAIAVTLSLPGGTILTLAGGLMFGPFLGTLYVVIGATLGATLLFLAARSSLGEILHRRAGPWLRKLEQGFNRDAWSYLLILRLVPIFPFFVVNLVPAFLNVSWRCYVATTFIGIIPGAFVYALVGSGFGDVLAAGGDISLDAVVSPKIIAALCGLAALAALPILYKRFLKKAA